VARGDPQTASGTGSFSGGMASQIHRGKAAAIAREVTVATSSATEGGMTMTRAVAAITGAIEVPQPGGTSAQRTATAQTSATTLRATEPPTAPGTFRGTRR